jgi:predicted ATPase with chaperone activity
MDLLQKIKGQEQVKRAIEVALVRRHELTIMCEGSRRDVEHLIMPLLDQLDLPFIILEPCLCGFYGSVTRECVCTQSEIMNHQRYNARITPVMYIVYPRTSYEKLTSSRLGEPLDVMMKRVERARTELPDISLKLDQSAQSLLNAANKQLDFDQYQYDTIREISHSIAALASRQNNMIGVAHIAEAIQYVRKVG